MTTPAPTLTATEEVAVEALREVLRVERLLATKRKAFSLASFNIGHDGGASATYVEVTQTMINDAAERLEKEDLSRWAP